MAALLVERSFIDLRSQVTINGVCNISSSDVKCLVSDKVRAKVWCAASVSFSLWYLPTSNIALFFFFLGWRIILLIQISNTFYKNIKSNSLKTVEDDVIYKLIAR